MEAQDLPILNFAGEWRCRLCHDRARDLGSSNESTVGDGPLIAGWSTINVLRGRTRCDYHRWGIYSAANHHQLARLNIGEVGQGWLSIIRFRHSVLAVQSCSVFTVGEPCILLHCISTLPTGSTIYTASFQLREFEPLFSYAGLLNWDGKDSYMPRRPNETWIPWMPTGEMVEKQLQSTSSKRGTRPIWLGRSIRDNISLSFLPSCQGLPSIDVIKNSLRK